MAYLLDTDIVIPVQAGDAATKQTVSTLLPSGIAISMVTYMEAFQGVIESVDPVAARTAFDAFLTDVPILPFSIEVARLAPHCAAFSRHRADACGLAPST